MLNGWDRLHSDIQKLTQEICEEAPDADTADEGEAYVMRVLTTCLNDSFLAHLMAENGLGRVLPTRGAPNPDYIMQRALLDSGRSYQLSGCLNDSERLGVGLFRVGEGGSIEIAEYLFINSANTDQCGNFLLDIRAGAAGPNALDLQADACILLVRTLHRSDSGQTTTMRLLGAAAPSDLSLIGGSTVKALERAAQTSIGSVRQFFSWSRQASAYPNEFRGEIEGLSQTIQGDPDTQYFLGYFELADGESLQVSIPSGLDCYWSVHAYNHWCEYLPGASAHDLNTQAGSDSAITLNIGPALSADTPNRIDTKGRKRGVLVCRVIGGTLCEPPQTRVLDSGDQ